MIPSRLCLHPRPQAHNRLRDASPDQLLTLYCALARLGYAPRPQVAAGLAAAAARLAALMSPEQLGALALAAASFDRWVDVAAQVEVVCQSGCRTCSIRQTGMRRRLGVAGCMANVSVRCGAGNGT